MLCTHDAHTLVTCYMCMCKQAWTSYVHVWVHVFVRAVVCMHACACRWALLTLPWCDSQKASHSISLDRAMHPEYTHSYPHMPTIISTCSQLSLHAHNYPHMPTIISTCSQLSPHAHNYSHMPTSVPTRPHLSPSVTLCRHTSVWPALGCCCARCA